MFMRQDVLGLDQSRFLVILDLLLPLLVFRIPSLYCCPFTIRFIVLWASYTDTPPTSTTPTGALSLQATLEPLNDIEECLTTLVLEEEKASLPQLCIELQIGGSCAPLPLEPQESLERLLDRDIVRQQLHHLGWTE